VFRSTRGRASDWSASIPCVDPAHQNQVKSPSLQKPKTGAPATSKSIKARTTRHTWHEQYRLKPGNANLPMGVARRHSGEWRSRATSPRCRRGWAAFGVTGENIAWRLLGGSAERMGALNRGLDVHWLRTALCEGCGRKPRRRKIRPSREPAVEPPMSVCGLMAITIQGPASCLLCA
jgi:hypothetical protein